MKEMREDELDAGIRKWSNVKSVRGHWEDRRRTKEAKKRRMTEKTKAKGKGIWRKVESGSRRAAQPTDDCVFDNGVTCEHDEMAGSSNVAIKANAIKAQVTSSIYKVKTEVETKCLRFKMYENERQRTLAATTVTRVGHRDDKSKLARRIVRLNERRDRPLIGRKERPNNEWTKLSTN